MGADQIAAASRASTRRALLFGASAVALVHFVLVTHAGWSYATGDFLHSLPGPHVQYLNPRLWVSPDLQGAAGHDRYIYGPTQHLTVLPLMLLDSYRQVARILLGVYAVLMLGAVYFMWRTFGSPRVPRSELLALLVVAMFFFPPAMQAFLQREFEVVVLFVFTLAAWSLVKGREARAGALFGYITWFKGFPVITFVYLMMRRRLTAAAAYTACSVLVLVAAHAAFGLQSFRLMAGWAEFFLRPLVSTSGGFCASWNPVAQTQTNLQWGLCGLSHRWPWLPAQHLFYAIVIVVGGLALQAFVRCERAKVSGDEVVKWRTVWELSLLAIAMSFFIHNEYYYLILLVFPVAALASRYWIDGTLGGPKGWLLAASYVLLGTFIISPTTPFIRLLGISGWDLFTEYILYLYGGLILLALVLREYHALVRRCVCLER
jgi:hypothetical protein